MYCTAVPAPADHPHALLCVELCVSAEVHHTAAARWTLACVRRLFRAASVCTSIVRTRESLQRCCCQLGHNSSVTSLQHHCSQIIPKFIIITLYLYMLRYGIAGIAFCITWVTIFLFGLLHCIDCLQLTSPQVIGIVLIALIT